MLRKFYLYSLLFLSLASCTASVSESVDPDAPTISSQTAQGTSYTGDTFVLKTATYRSQELFGKKGYMVNLYDKAADCNSGTPPISFFITELKQETLKGQGPYFYYYIDSKNFGTGSYFGCDVIITKVTPTAIEGKVKGGDLKGKGYIEGAFSASLCQ